MKCQHCDSPISDTARYCENCGTALQDGNRERKMAEAYYLELKGDLDAAVEAYEALIGDDDGERDPDGAALRKHLGNLHFRLGHLRRARAHLIAASRLSPSNATIWHDLGVIAYHMAEFDESIDCFRRALDNGGGLQLSHFWMGNALYHRGDFAAAAEAFRELIDGYPNFTIARFHLGVIYARQGERKMAAEEFRRVLLENPEDVVARFYVGKTGQPTGG